MTEKKISTIKMVRDKETYPVGPHVADVHPSEVANFAAVGWTLAKAATKDEKTEDEKKAEETVKALQDQKEKAETAKKEAGWAQPPKV